MNRLRQLWHYLDKVFALPARLQQVRDRRVYPVIPTAALHFSLLCGALLRVPSLHDLALKTRGRGWQRLIGHGPISDDALGYVLEHGCPEDWRQVLVQINRQLKSNKQLERAKIGGLLVVTLDGNEQFHSRSRCCPACSQRRLTVKGPEGQEQEVTEYVHRQVYAHITGPDFCVILDVEPIGPGEEEARAALRLLGRLRRLYGVRFFDVVSVDAWYATGPFVRAVEKLGWGVVSVLKQQRYTIYQEASALRRQEKPECWQHQDRRHQLWDIQDLDFTEEALGKVRVVIADEAWTQTRVVGGQRVSEAKTRHWRWLASGRLQPVPARVIWQIGHQRWGIENHAFNELTQGYGLEHCARHEPVALLVWLLIRVLGFVLFELYAKVHCQTVRRGLQTLQDLCDQLWLDLGRWEELEPLWSG